MPTRKSRDYKWYIEPLDLNTNAALARELSEENTSEIHDAEGKTRQVYLIPSKKLSKFRNSKSQAGFRFNVLCQEGNGKIRFSFLPAIQRKKRLGLPKLARTATAA
jgi:hypothetical protein